MIAEQELNNIKQRQAEGFAVAKAKDWSELYVDWKAGKITAVSFMKEVGIKKELSTTS